MTKLLQQRSRCIVASGLLLLLTVTLASAQLQRSPINPDFLEFQDRWLTNRWTTTTESGFPLGYIPSPVDPTPLQVKPRDLMFGRLGAPVAYDLRTIPEKLSPIHHQGSCGSCWTFSTMASLESWLRPGDPWDFSENNLKNRHGFDLGPCAGGNATIATAYLLRWDGPVSEADDPYSPTSTSSPSGLPVRKHVQEVLFLPTRTDSLDNDIIKNAILTYGAVHTSYYHSDAYYNSTYKTYYYSGASNPNHAVAIVGWNDAFSASKFSSTPPGNGAFIVRNSWGTNWGEEGYFYVSYYDTQFARSEVVMFANAELPTNYEKIYSYDPLGQVGRLNNTWAANVFTKSADPERVCAVGFYTPAAGTSYEVRVYRNPTSGPVTGGTLVASETGTQTFAGYHTVVLDPPAELAASDTRFSAVVYLSGGGTYQHAYEWAYPMYASGATASPGQSYYSFDGVSWGDLTSYVSSGNYCIKAYTIVSTSTNREPSAPTEVTISPSAPKTTDNLTATASGSTDPDGDTVTYSYEWCKSTNGGSNWDAWGRAGEVLTSDNTTKGEQWKARARASDGSSYSAWVESSPVTIGNTAPTPPTVEITPSNPQTTDDLTVSASSSTDPDGDSITYRYRWYLNNALQSAYDDAIVIPSSATAPGQRWKCVVTPTDGTDDGPSAEDEVVIRAGASPSLSWTGEAGYENDGVHPDTGRPARGPSPTTFVFKVLYTDPSGEAPTSACCRIQKLVGPKSWETCDEPAMTLESGNLVTGAVYACSLLLENETYRYCFAFQDAHGNPVEGPPASWIIASPRLIGRPQLGWLGKGAYLADGVDPDTGHRGTKFWFRVRYWDSEGDMPTKARLQVRCNGVLGLDKALKAGTSGSWTCGIQYYTWARFRIAGTREYRFVFEDNDGPAKGAPIYWQSGPQVTSEGSSIVTTAVASPTAAGAQLTLGLTDPAWVTVTVLNVAGRPIRTLITDKFMEAGTQTVLWNRRADNGLLVPRGVYLVQVTARSADGSLHRAITSLCLR
ncbi:MAG: lectin like domain-containing protein [Candidatus Zipacnadales bacterium]